MNESGNVRATWDQLYPMGQLFGPSDLGQPFLLKVTKRIGPYINHPSKDVGGLGIAYAFPFLEAYFFSLLD